MAELCVLTKNNSNHERLHKHPVYGLETHNEYSFGTFFCCRTNTVPNCMLGFNREKETGREAVDIEDTWHPLIVGCFFHQRNKGYYFEVFS